MVIDHVQLVLVMGLAAAGVIAMILLPSGAVSAAVFAVAWYLLCFVPVLFMQEVWWPDPLDLGAATDFAAAAPLHLTLYGLVGAAGLAGATRASRAHPATERTRRSGIRTALMTAGGVLGMAVGWSCWLVALEGEISRYTADMALNCLVLVIVGSGIATAMALVRRRGFIDDWAVSGAIAGLAAASGAAASLPLGGAVAVGVIAGAAGGVIASQLRIRRVPHGERRIAAAGIGAVVGLIALGLLDDRAGFFFSGQPTLALAQVTLVVVALTIGFAVGLAFALLLRLGRVRRA